MMHAMASTHAITRASSLMNVKIACTTYVYDTSLGQWNKENER